MPRLPNSVPKYRKHRASGHAIVTLSSQDHYLGPHGTQASKIEYDRKVMEWLANHRQPIGGHPNDLTLAVAIASYWQHVSRYYVKHGRPTGEQAGIRCALRPVLQLYGESPASQFSSLALKAVREKLILSRLARSTINQHVSRIRRIFKWLAAEHLVPVEVYQSLAVLDGLSKGRTAAREPAPVKPVDDAVVDLTSLFQQH